MPREIPELRANDEPWSAIEAGIRFAFSAQNLGRQYEVQVRSGKSLREKWPQLVAAARRAGPSRGQQAADLHAVWSRYVGGAGHGS